MSNFFAMAFDMNPLTAGDVILRIVLAVVFGGVIGLERGIRNHPAGFRTHILVCLGACLAMLVNQFVFDAVGAAGTDPTRIGAQVISGIGFLGVGTIFMAGRNTVRGLTTAAGLWASGAIGLAIGIGFYFAGFAVTIAVAIVLGAFPALEDLIYRKARRVRIHLETATLEEEKAASAAMEQAGNVIHSRRVSTIVRTGQDTRVSTYYTVQIEQGADSDEFIEQVAALPGVRLVEIL
ncbi:MAG: MgtC/SapB family protein [Clostridiales bacterium]|nr:MgtC/SapB family protein [Clostridiales bacterium]